MAQDPTKEMSFLDHLEELRKHLIRAVVIVLIFTVIAFMFMDVIFHEILLAPARPDFWTYRMFCKVGQMMGENGLCVEKIDFILQSRTLSGQFSMHLMASFVTGLIAAFPYVFWEVWRFVSPGLYLKERSITAGAVIYVTSLFAAGILFGYYIVAPVSINFLANYKLDPSIMNQFDITSYISTVCMMVLGSGLMFQLPMVVYVLSRLGLLTPAVMRTYRKHAVVIIFVVAAILTPSPDVLSQMLVGVPLWFLYELSIFISGNVERSRKKQAASI